MKRTISIALAGVFLMLSAMVALGQTKPAPPAGAAATAKDGLAKRLGGKGDGKGFILLHADGVAMKRDGAKVDVRIQKGIIQAVSSTSITLKSPDGYTQTYAIDGETRVREKRQASSVADLKTGEMAKVMAVKQGDGYVARLINCTGEPGPRLQKLMEGA